MPTRKLEPVEWQGYFSAMGHNVQARAARVEVTGLDIGDQVEAEWLPLLGITYEPREKVLNVAVEGMDHMIVDPQEIYVQEEPDLQSLEVRDADGHQQIIKLRPPLKIGR